MAKRSPTHTQPEASCTSEPKCASRRLIMYASSPATNSSGMMLGGNLPAARNARSARPRRRWIWTVRWVSGATSAYCCASLDAAGAGALVPPLAGALEPPLAAAFLAGAAFGTGGGTCVTMPPLSSWYRIAEPADSWYPTTDPVTPGPGAPLLGVRDCDAAGSASANATAASARAKRRKGSGMGGQFLPSAASIYNGFSTLGTPKPVTTSHRPALAQRHLAQQQQHGRVVGLLLVERRQAVGAHPGVGGDHLRDGADARVGAAAVDAVVLQ